MIGLYFDDQIQALIDELRTYLAQSVNGAQIHWSQTILALIAWPVHRMSDGRFVRTFISILIWLLTCLTTYPLVRFTFKNPIQIQQAVLLYTIGLLIPPLIIAARTRTVSDEFWQCNGPDNPAVLRLYTHQGAFVGYTIGQFTVFFPALFAYYVGIGPPSPLVWGLASLWPILLSMASARQVPFNLWRAYGELHLRDGWIFFTVVLSAPVWAWFFYTFHPLLLSRITGPLIFFLAISLMIGISAWQNRRKDRKQAVEK